MSRSYPLIVKHDLDGFFGLAVDNLVQLLLIVNLCAVLCGMTGEDQALLYAHILPGAAVSLILGNLFYAWQAHRLARREGRDDVTALPYGINTPSLLVYIYFVMMPVYQRTGSAHAAWQMGLLACLGSGVIEFCGAFVAERIRRHTPRAALLATLAGIAIGFISMTFALQIFQHPLVAMLPMAVILVTYFSRVRFPFGVPGGLLAVVAGTVLAWVLPDAWLARPMDAAAIGTAWQQRRLYLPSFAGGEILAVLGDEALRAELLGYLSVIVPMGLFNVIGSLQNIESAEAGGDRFATGPSLAINGVGTIAAALFGSCFPTTIYIGHPGWKGLGARAGYSTLNGLFMTAICLTGTVAVINTLVPTDAGVAIVLWIGIVITAQAYQATPREHAPAVAIGLFPAVAAWGATAVAGAFIASGGATMESLLKSAGSENVMLNGFLLHGMNLLGSPGYMLTCMILAAVAATLIDRRFNAAAIWSLAAVGLTLVGLTHAYHLTGNVVSFIFILAETPKVGVVYRAYNIAAGYALFAGVFALVGLYHRKSGERRTNELQTGPAD
jgi:AGZA family xanthine/uracil permease-like MFS transporter